MRERDGARRQASVRVDGAKRAAGSVASVSVSRGDAPDRRSARVGVHEDQTILVAAQRLQGFRSGWYISEPGTLKKHESLSARAGSVRDVDNGNGGSKRAGPPSGGPVRSIRKNIVLPGRSAQRSPHVRAEPRWTRVCAASRSAQRSPHKMAGPRQTRVPPADEIGRAHV